MDNTEFTKIYSILGVFQDDGWEMIRAAYKKQIKRWHPDRFQDPEHRTIAEEKSKEINLAYQKLSEYYEKFGALPPDHHSETTSSFGIQGSAESISADTNHPAHSYARPNSITPTRPRSSIPIILIGALIALSYSIWEPTISGQSGPTDVDLAIHPGMRGDDGSTMKSDDNSRAQDIDSMHVANLSNTNNANSWDEGPEGPDRHQKTITVNAPSSYKTAFDLAATSNTVILIKRGTTKSEVLAVQGPPQRQTDSAWDYGASRIYFEGGHVSGWHENPLYPLRIVR